MPGKKRADVPASVPPARAPLVALWVTVPLVIAGLMWYYLRLSRAAAGEIGFPLDDSWIHVRFAQNLAAGKGFSFNPGVATSTTTSVLWTLLLAACYRITDEYLYTSIVVNWALCVGLCVLVYQLSLTLDPGRWLALAAATVTAVTVPLPWWALSGMEPPLYAGLALLAILLHLRRRGEEAKRREGSVARALFPTVVMALAGLARPELLLLFPLAMVDRLVMARWGDREPGAVSRWFRDLALSLLLFALIVAPQFLYNHRVTGYWLPTSFYSKILPTSFSRAAARGEWSVILANPFNEWWALVRMWAANNALLVVPFLLECWLLVRRAFAREEQTRSLLIPMVLVVQPALWAVLGGFRDPAYQSQRYVANLNLLFILLGVYGGWWVTERVAVLRTSSVRVALVIVALALSLMQQPEAARTYALNVKNITEMQVTIARWLRNNAPGGSVLAVNDVGAVGVIAEDPVLDLQGLVTPEALAARAEAFAQLERKEPPLALSEFVFSRRPDYLVIFPQWYPEMEARRDLLTPVFWVELRDNITSGAPVMVVYRTVWAGKRR